MKILGVYVGHDSSACTDRRISNKLVYNYSRKSGIFILNQASVRED